MRSRPVIVFCGAVVGLAVFSTALAAPGRLTHRSVPVRAMERRSVQCDEVGFCKKGEKRLLLQSKNPLTSAALKLAFAKGCRAARHSKEKIGIVCPSSVNVPNARVERVFQMEDVFSAQQIGALNVQNEGIKGNGVLAAVLDTGVDANHPELIGKVAIIQNFTTDPPDDVVGHGTHVTGIIAGQGVRSDGSGNRALGVSPGASVIVGKICNDQGYCMEGDIIAGIEWAVQRHARVINMSLGGGGSLTDCDDDPLAQSVNWAVDQGTVVVIAAGNGGASGEGVAVPACASKAIAVGAVDAAGTRTPWSSYGVSLDVMAPGSAILSSVPCSAAGTCTDGGYAQWSGTSMAAPHVTGVVDLLLTVDPTLTPAAVHTLLTGTATDLGDFGFDPLTGYGLVNAAAAVQELQNRSSSSSVSSSSSRSSSGQNSPPGGASSTSSSTVSSSSDAASSSSTSTSSSFSSSAASSSSTSSTSSSSSASSSPPASSSSASSSETGEGESRHGNSDGQGNDADGRGDGGSDHAHHAEPPPSCAADAWFCTGFDDCKMHGQQFRLCMLVNAHCKNPDTVHPPESRSCVPPRQDRDRQNPQKEDRQDQREQKHEGRNQR